MSRQRVKVRWWCVVGVVLFFGWRVEAVGVTNDSEVATLRSQLELREIVIRRLQESLAVARTESEMYREKWTEAQLLAQTLGANPLDSQAVAVQRELVATLQRLALAEARQQRLAEQLARLVRAVQSNENVAVELASAQDVLAALVQSAGDGVTTGEPARLVAAKILDVNPHLRAVVLDVGAQQGARVGMPFEVWQRDRLVAELRVVEVRARVSAALVERQDRGEKIAVGDEARVAGRRQTPAAVK